MEARKRRKTRILRVIQRLLSEKSSIKHGPHGETDQANHSALIWQTVRNNCFAFAPFGTVALSTTQSAVAASKRHGTAAFTLEALPSFDLRPSLPLHAGLQGPVQAFALVRGLIHHHRQCVEIRACEGFQGSLRSTATKSLAAKSARFRCRAGASAAMEWLQLETSINGRPKALSGSSQDPQE